MWLIINLKSLEFSIVLLISALFLPNSVFFHFIGQSYILNGKLTDIVKLFLKLTLTS